MTEQKITEFNRRISETFESGFISITLGNYKGLNSAIKNIYIKKIAIKAGLVLSFTYRNKTNDIVKNYPLTQALEQLKKELEEGFLMATLFTVENDFLLEKKANQWALKTMPPSKNGPQHFTHDKNKNHLIAPSKPYLQQLGVTDKNGQVLKSSQDKFRQINHYIEVLKNELKALPEGEELHAIDMGSGKGYLTFALYDFLTHTLNKEVKITGVEFRNDLVQLCNEIATKNGFNKLQFKQSSIVEYAAQQVDVLIALHACDTATDDAIAYGIKSNARLIVVAPCCHKQIRREIEKNSATNEMEFVTQHGIFLERQAEMVTDSIRALYLNLYGYHTKVFEFITDAHTPKNIMIIAEKRSNNVEKEKILKKITNAKLFFGINTHFLEQSLGLNS